MPTSATSAAPAASASTPEASPAPVGSEERVIIWDYPRLGGRADARRGLRAEDGTGPLPVLVTFHGLGEAEKGPEKGARGWIDDYGLETAVHRLAAPPLTKKDMQTLGTASWLQAMNAGLQADPYRRAHRGVSVHAQHPWGRSLARCRGCARPITWCGRCCRAFAAKRRALAQPAATGIDGVSLGGRAALLVGAKHPDAFGAVGSLQAAIYDHELAALTKRLAAARAKNPALQLRVLTSSADFYRGVLNELSKRLSKSGVDHTFVEIDRGPHSYAFNRGPGVYEMLLFHDRALRLITKALRAPGRTNARRWRGTATSNRSLRS